MTAGNVFEIQLLYYKGRANQQTPPPLSLLPASLASSVAFFSPILLNPIFVPIHHHHTSLIRRKFICRKLSQYDDDFLPCLY